MAAREVFALALTALCVAALADKIASLRIHLKNAALYALWME